MLLEQVWKLDIGSVVQESTFCYLAPIIRFCCTSVFLMLQSECAKLEVENAHFEKQLGELLKQTTKTSSKITFLEKENIQLQTELEKAMVYYDFC
jgi:peptidoglycan hydrolase CwlO-like protein